jgi:hypothetical protein
MPFQEIDLKGVDTSYPSIAPGKVRATIKGWEVKANEKGGHRLALKFELAEPANSDKNEVLSPGFVFNSNLNLPDSPSGEEQNDRNKRSLASFMDAVFKSDAESRPAFNSETMNACIDKQVIVTFKKKKEVDEFGSTQVSVYAAIQEG